MSDNLVKGSNKSAAFHVYGDLCESILKQFILIQVYV